MSRVAPEYIVLWRSIIMDIATKMIIPGEMDNKEKIDGKKEATESRII